MKNTKLKYTQIALALLAAVSLGGCSNNTSKALKACPPPEQSNQENLTHHEVEADLEEVLISGSTESNILEWILRQSGYTGTANRLNSLSVSTISSYLNAKGYQVSTATSWEGFQNALNENMIYTTNVKPILINIPNKVIPQTAGEDGNSWVVIVGCTADSQGMPVTLEFGSPNLAGEDKVHLSLAAIPYSQLECLIKFYGLQEDVDVVY